MITPSWADYGTHDEAYYPELWHGCIGAWCPSLGMSGAVLYDHSRALQHGALVNMPATRWVSGPAGMIALDFIGGTNPAQRVDLGTLPYDLSVVATQPFSITAWAYVRAWRGITNYEIFCIFNVGSQDYKAFYLVIYEKRLVFTADTTGSSYWDAGIKSENLQPFSPTDLPLGTWLHCAVTRDVAGRYVLYVNGQWAAERTLTTNLVLNSLAAKIGAHYALNTTYDTDGYINDVRLYRRALPPEEIALLASAHAVAYIPRRRTVRRLYSIPASFNPAWARHSNIYIPAGARQ
jgi:hypothetical protein